MGLLSAIFGRKPKFEARIFSKNRRKFTDLADRTKEDEDAGVFSLILYHFEDTHEQLHEQFPGAAELRDLNRHSLAELDQSRNEGNVALLPVSEIPRSISDPSAQIKPADLNLRIHLAERFPAAGPDDAVLRLAAYATPKKNCLVYVGMDEPWMALFCTDGLKELLDRLGFEEDECMSGGMLTNSIENALKKVAAACPKPWKQADSAEQWLQLNQKH